MRDLNPTVLFFANIKRGFLLLDPNVTEQHEFHYKIADQQKQKQRQHT